VLESHNDGGSRIPEQGTGEDHTAAEPVCREPEQHGADEESGEGGGDKTGETVEAEERRGGPRKQAASHQARSDVGGEEEIIHLKASTQGKQ